MKRCPECLGQVQSLGKDFFCLDCDFDTLKPSSFQGVAKTKELSPPRRRPRPRRNTAPRWIEIDAEWYFKTQLKNYRKWKDRDFHLVEPDYIHNAFYTTNYFHRSTVEAHEQTAFFIDHPRRQTPVPDDERINELAFNLTVRGDELIRNGWTYEMIDALGSPFVPHKWRRKRKFLLVDLKTVSETFCVGEQVHPLPRLGGPPPNPYRFE